MKNVGKRYKLAVESLERRDLMAGNVSVQLRGGALSIVGDDQDNAVLISQPTAGQITVAPANASTTINGASKPVTHQILGQDVRIQSRGGNDSITFGDKPGQSISFPRNLEIEGGGGDNSVEAIANLVVLGRLQIRNGSGNDSNRFMGTLNVRRDVEIENGKGLNVTELDQGVNNIGGNLTIRDGQGTHIQRAKDTNVQGNVNFEVGSGPSGESSFQDFFEEDSVASMRIGGNLVMSSQSGEHRVSRTIGNTNVGGNATLISWNSGPSSNEVYVSPSYGSATIRGRLDIIAPASRVVSASIGEGTLSPTVDLIVRGGLSIVTGSGADSISVVGTTVLGPTFISSNQGDDDLFVIDSKFMSSLVIIAGAGNDRLRIEYGPDGASTQVDVQGFCTIDMGSGDDFLGLGDPLRAQALRFNRGAVLLGGAGTQDRLDASKHVLSLKNLSHLQFEFLGGIPA
jgi:hypothetical protein